MRPITAEIRIGAGVEVHDLTVQFATRDGVVMPVAGVNFNLRPGEIVGLVGESGSGKSVTAQSLLGMWGGSQAKVTGSIRVDGEELVGARWTTLRRLRGSTIAMVFQDALAALHPCYTIGQQMAEAYRIHRRCSRKEARARAIEVLASVGIPSPASRLSNYPHQFSGGMRQRAMIAMAMMCEPRYLVADEPTTALDVTVQDQVLHLLTGLRDNHGTGILLITHDIGVVARICDRVVVMYGGRIVESGRVEDVLGSPRMPYTQALLECSPRLDRARQEHLPAIPGSPPSLLGVSRGCPFAPRCVHAQTLGGVCETSLPHLVEVASDHISRCHLTSRAAGVEGDHD